MVLVCFGTVEEPISLVADLLAIGFYLTIFFTYLAWRLINSRSGEGVQALYFVPPLISSEWGTFQQFGTTKEEPPQLVFPVVSCTLLNPDIFSETLLDVSLEITNLSASSNYETKIFWISESENPFTLKNNLIEINGGGLFGKKIIGRGAERRFNFYFLAAEPENFTLGNLAPGKYNATLHITRKKIRTRIETIVLEFDVLEKVYSDFMNRNSIATFLTSVGTHESRLRILPRKRNYRFWNGT